ncbi:MAG: serine/threonine protein kinase [Verrucomicrobiaceae bacterium]|nr:serine/threonine protein kinase [Verrucomicrobiaceae bacterium]
MSSLAPDTCLECGSVIDTALMGGVCPRCLLGDVMHGRDEDRAGMFDGHELLGEIARGGMGVVYRARQLEPERVVALKTMRGASLDSVEARARFKHEAEVMVSLDHPAILPVHHFGEEDGIPFFTMKLADGGTLAQKIERYAGQWREIAALMNTLCDAVRHAHERGVLHRDLKPGNVLFDAAGQAYVSDFGIAKLTDARDAMTLTMSVLGTPHYLAPEVAHQGPKAASVSSDVWSLGVILFELLTGRRPFEGESVTMLLRALDANDAPFASTMRKDVPRDLAVITGKALQRDPSKRYASAHDLADDLRAWLEGRPIKARAVPLLERAWLWSRRNPLQAALAMMLGIALVAAMMSLAFGLRAARRETQRVSAAQSETQKQLRTALLHQARSGRVSREMGWRAAGISALQRAHSIEPGGDVRDELIAHLAGYDLIKRERGFVDVVLPSPSLKFCVRTKDDEVAMAVARLDDLTNLFDLPDRYDGLTTNVIFGAADEWVAVGTQAGTRVFSMTGDHRELAHWPGDRLKGAADDRSLLHLGSADGWKMADTTTWQITMQGTSSPQGVKLQGSTGFVPTFHPGEATLGVISEGQEVRVIDRTSGTDVQRITPVQPGLGYGWAGAKLIVNTGDLGQVFDYQRGRETFLAPAFGSPLYMTATRRGSELLASSLLRKTSLWHLLSGQRLVAGTDFIAQQIANDDEHFTSRSPVSEIGRIVRPKVMEFLPDSLLKGSITVRMRALAISPDSRWLVAHDGTQLVVHELSSGKLLARMETTQSMAPGFSADGTQLLMLHATGLDVISMTREGKQLMLKKTRDIPVPGGRRFMSGRLLLDGERFLASTSRAAGRCELWRMHRDKLVWERQPAPESPTAGFVDVTPDGIFNIGGQNQMNVINNIQKMKFCLPDPGNLRACLGAFSPDATQLAMVDALQGWLFYDQKEWLQPKADKPLKQTMKVSGNVSGAQMPVWASSGRWVAMSPDARRVSLVDGRTHQVHLTLESPLDLMLDALVISPDERTLVLQRVGGSIEVWHLDQLASELQALGVKTTLPVPLVSKATPPVLQGEFDENPLPAWTPKWEPRQP